MPQQGGHPARQGQVRSSAAPEKLSREAAHGGPLYVPGGGGPTGSMSSLMRCPGINAAYSQAENPKFETRNPKQARITEIQMSKTIVSNVWDSGFEHWVI
jgi:hypothetical protein